MKLKPLLRFLIFWTIVTGLSFYCFICLYAIREGADPGILWNFGLYISYIILGPWRVILSLTSINLLGHGTKFGLFGGLVFNSFLVTIIAYSIWTILIRRRKSTLHNTN